MASQSTGNLKKLKLHICTWGLRSCKVYVSNVKVFVSDAICMGLFHMCYA